MSQFVYEVITGIRDEKRSFGRPRSRWDNINIDVQEIVLEHGEIIYLAELRACGKILKNMAMKFRIAYMAGNSCTAH